MNWQPIETAPTDRRILLYYYQTHELFVVGKWNNDEYVGKPKPYWSTDRLHMGITWHRANNPSHWAELVAPE